MATILTTSSSATICPNPTRCGTCLALAPHTKAYLNVSLRVRWTWSQTSSMVDPFRTMSASEKSGSMPFLRGKLGDRERDEVKTYLFVYILIKRNSSQHLSTTSWIPRSSSQLMTQVWSSRASLSRKSRLTLSILL